MEERQVTVDGVTHILPEPFMVLATQNPIEYEGTFPLPEAQLDRFLLRVRLGYPALLDEIHILEKQQLRHPIDTLVAVISPEEVIQAQTAIKSVYVSDAIKRYIVELIRATRESGDIYLGSSPRGSLGLYRVGQARAAMHGRDYVLPDDIKFLAEHVLSHRMIVDPAARLRNISGDLIIQEILRSLPVPGGHLGR
jgi:MoxR-like ATPase